MEMPTKGSVDAALAQIDKDGVPANNRSTEYCFVVGGRHYPPKWTLALALGKRSTEGLTGGPPTNDVLLGATKGFPEYTIERCDCGNANREISS